MTMVEKMIESAERLEVLADGCPHCIDMRNEAADLRADIAMREAEDLSWLDSEIDRALASAEVCRSWASEVRTSPNMPSADSLIAAARCFDLVALELERAKR